VLHLGEGNIAITNYQTVHKEQGYSKRFESNGLELALEKKYCDINGVQIIVESKKEVGLKFNLKIKNKASV
jgi:light-regulated signal transduction histidine kinase (bacteriophytochrome)